MFEFTGWCFLCAQNTPQQEVNVKIQSLDEAIREHIGQFSLINFTLAGAPSNICQDCSHFLRDYEKRKETYAMVERMYTELLKMKNKSVDMRSIRSKYKLDESNVDTTSKNDAHQIEMIEYTVDDEDINYTVDNQPSTPVCKSEKPSIEPSAKSLGNKRKTNVTSPSVNAPIILNHLLGPKITRSHRMELFGCDLCSNTTSTKLSMERHMKQVHSDGSSSIFRCQHCPKTFAKKIVLQNHQKIHMDRRPTFACELCGKVLSSQTAVANHLKWLHSDTKDFQCDKCLKMFATKGSLKEHEKTHYELKAHICAICKKSYKTASTLNQHLDTHGETSYSCNDCGLRLNSKRTLRQHMLKHSDVIRHTCEICNAKFKRTKAYKEHLISLHTEIRAYTCDWCNKSFANGANFRKHKKEAHPEELKEADKKQTTKFVKLPKIDELLSMSLEKYAGK